MTKLELLTLKHISASLLSSPSPYIGMFDEKPVERDVLESRIKVANFRTEAFYDHLKEIKATIDIIIEDHKK